MNNEKIEKMFERVKKEAEKNHQAIPYHWFVIDDIVYGKIIGYNPIVIGNIKGVAFFEKGFDYEL